MTPFTAASNNAPFGPASPLARQLRARGVAEVAVCGLALEYCVLATALGAADAGFERVALVRGEGARAHDARSERASEAALRDKLVEKERDAGGRVRVRLVETFAEALEP